MLARILPLAAVGLLATASATPAQFFPRFGPQVPSGMYVNSPLGGYYFNTFQSYQYTVTSMSLGRPITLHYEYSWSGPRPSYYYAPPTYYGSPYQSPSGSGSFGSESYNPLVERQRAALARAQRANEWDKPVAGRKDEVDNWVAAQNRGANDNRIAGPAIDPKLLDPADEAILSGKSLNELLALCQAQEKAGRRAESGLCPPDLLEKVVFEGGPAAAGINLFRKPKLAYPAVVVVPDTDKLRAAIDVEFATIGQSLRNGKKPNLFVVDRLDVALASARKALTVRLKDAPFAEEKEVNEFLTQLELTAKFSRNADAPAALSASWNTTGATVAELSRLMEKFKLRFAPAPTGGEPAYLSLHRGLLGYYIRLTPVPAAK